MKKIFKNIMALAVLALNFSACTDEVEYTPATPSDVDSTAYHFAYSQETAFVLPLNATQITVTLERLNAEVEETIVLSSVADEEIFTIPESVTFAAGERTATIEIAISEALQPFQSEDIKISLPNELINPYKVDNYSTFTATVLKEDYLPYGKGVYVWGFFGVQYYNEMHYSEYLDAFRIVTPWTTIADQYVAGGYKAEKGKSVDFTVDEEGKVELLSKKMKSGLIHPSYGSVYAELQEAEMMEDGTFYFNYKWTVAAGSFGAYEDYFVLTEIY